MYSLGAAYGWIGVCAAAPFTHQAGPFGALRLGHIVHQDGSLQRICGQESPGTQTLHCTLNHLEEHAANKIHPASQCADKDEWITPDGTRMV
jgi:hypothetical protein